MSLNANTLGTAIYNSLKKEVTVYAMDENTGTITSSTVISSPLDQSQCNKLATEIIEHITAYGTISTTATGGQTCTYSGIHPLLTSTGSIS